MNSEKSVYLSTLGCAKNEVDSGSMSSVLRQAGYSIVEDPECADCLIINTCSFIEAATQESIDAIFDLLDLKDSKGAKIIVVGCMVSRYKDKLKELMPEVDAFVSCDEETHIDKFVEDLIGKGTAQQSEQTEELKASEYIKISEGCNRTCSFCMIPSIRGKYRSRTYDDIRASVKNAISQGAKELNIIAQDTGSWGSDFNPKSTLATLLSDLAEEFSDTYFRVLYVQPDNIDDELIEAIKNHDNIVNYLDIPLQHTSKRILKLMNRSGSASEFRELVDHIRDAIPDMVLRTTLMVGFPTETDEEFSELLDFVSEGLFDYVGSFAYSNEEGSLASQIDDQIEEDEKKYRLETLSDYCNAVSVSKISSRVGQTAKVLVEDVAEDGQIVGRALFQAPEVDGFVLVDKGSVGDVLDVKFTEAFDYDLAGEVI